MNIRKRALWAAAGLLLPVLVLGLYLGWLEVSGNFAPIIDGFAYRSNQPTPERLAEYKAAYGIRTVINLRGAAPGEAWYDLEKQAAKDLGLTLIDVPLSSARDLSDTELQQLVALLRTVEGPVLIHCRSGSNRTGLAAAIYLSEIGQADAEVAGEQLSLRFGHVSVPFRPETSAMDRSWQRYLSLRGPGGADK
jgi:uncharacterized protein (TIGR01244 family)